MAVLRLIDALPDFGLPSRAPAPAATLESIVETASVQPLPFQPDIGEIVRTEVMYAQDALTARLSVAHEAALLEQNQRHAAEIEGLRAAFGGQAGALVAERLVQAEASMTGHIAAAVARLVGSVLTEDLRKRSIESLKRSIVQAIRDAETIRVEVSGPQSLFVALAEALSGSVVNLHHVETDDFDLTVTVDGTIIETRIAEWSSVLSEVLA